MSILIEQLINITDAIFLGHVGDIELGASALAGIWFLAIYMLGFGFSLGLQVVIARRNGERNYLLTGRTFWQGLSCLSLMAVILCVLSKLFSPSILRHLIASTEVYEAVTAYLDWRIWELLFSFPLLALRAFLVGITQTRILTFAAITAVLVNIPGNYLFIFVMDMGISGAALASSLTGFFSLLIVSFYVYKRLNKYHYGLHYCWDKHILKQVFCLSVWSMLHAFISVAPWFLFFVAVEHLGESELAVANIVRSISTLFFVVVSSFATTTGALVSNLIGANESYKLFSLCKRVIRLGYGVGFPLILLALVFHHFILGIYTDNEALICQAWLPYVAMLFNYGFALPAYVYMNAVTGTGATGKAFLFQLTTIIFYLFYLRAMSYWQVPLAVFWSAEYLFVILLAIQSMIYLKNRIKIKKL